MKKLLITILIAFILVVLGFLYFGVFCSIERTYVAVMDSDIRIIETAIDAYHDKHQKYPKTLQQLVDENILKKLIADPWGYEYQYTPSKGKYDLESIGYKLE